MSLLPVRDTVGPVLERGRVGPGAGGGFVEDRVLFEAQDGLDAVDSGRVGPGTLRGARGWRLIHHHHHLHLGR